MLDVLDRELERRGHRFARYAGDCNIYVRSRRAGERVMATVQRFLARRLELEVNAAKSAVDPPSRRKFLGFSFTAGKEPRRRIARRRRVKSRVRQLTRRTRGASLARIVEELSRYLVGWRGYFGICETPSVLRSLDQWVRRRLGHRLDAMEARTHPLCGAAPSRRRQGPGGSNRRKPARPLATQQQPRAHHRNPRCLPGNARPRERRQSTGRSTQRTAVYGPACTVAWEGRSRGAGSRPFSGISTEPPREPCPHRRANQRR